MIVLYSVKYMLGIKCLNFSGIVNKSVGHLYSEKYRRCPVLKFIGFVSVKIDWVCK